jgi:hypothetical protein
MILTAQNIKALLLKSFLADLQDVNFKAIGALSKANATPGYFPGK